MWERPDQEHEFGGTNRELRCRKHWGKEAPRKRKNSKPLAVDPGWKAGGGLEPSTRKMQAAGSESRKQRVRSGKRSSPDERSSPRLRIDMETLSRALRTAEGFLGKDPRKAALICTKALREGGLVMDVQGKKGLDLKQAFVRCRERAQKAVRDERQRAAERRTKTVVKDTPKRGSTGKSRKNAGGATPKQLAYAAAGFDEASRLLQIDPRRTVAFCNQVLRELRPFKGIPGMKNKRQRWFDLRDQALEAAKRDSRRKR